MRGGTGIAMNTRNDPLSFRGLGYYIPAVVATLAVLIAVFLAADAGSPRHLT